MTRKVIAAAKVGLIPDVMNDIAFHHAHINVDEIVHAVQDTVSIAILSLCL